MSDLKLYADASWHSPWAFHAMVALEELGLRYDLAPLRFPIAGEQRQELQRHALIPKVPCLVHGELWLTESSAISEYLAEQFPPPGHPRIMPADPTERARARQILSWLRTSLFALRDDRPTSSVFQRPVSKPLSENGRHDASTLIQVAEQLIPEGNQTMFDDYCVADTDLALALMRLIANSDQVPARLVDYTLAQWGRTSVRKYLAYIPTSH